ncbi:MAG: hypothetical protein AAFN10_04195 [Bacteroidota bacterium]
MKKQSKLLILLCIGCLGLTACGGDLSLFPTPQATGFVKLFGGTRDSEGRDMIFQPSTGNYTLIGSYGQESPNKVNNASLNYYDMYIAHTDVNGNLQWQMSVTIDSTNNTGLTGYLKMYQMEGVDIIAASDKRWCALANVSPLPDANIQSNRILIVDVKEGQIPDPETDFYYVNPIDFSATAYDMITTPDGGFLVLGHVERDANGRDAWLVKLNANFEQEWERQYDFQAQDEYPAVVEALPGGGYALLMSSFENKVSFDFSAHLFILDNDGNELATKKMGSGYLDAVEMQIEGQDIFVLVTVEDDTENPVSQTVARIYRLDRASLQAEVFAEFGATEGSLAFATDFDRLPDGGFIVASVADRLFLDQPSTDSTKFRTSYDYMIQKIEPSGGLSDPQDWPVYIGDSGYDVPASISAITSLGEVEGYVVGGTMGFGPSGTMALIKLDANGDFSP